MARRWGVQTETGLWVKFTCRFGAFHGSVVLTDDKRDARQWTREGDAERAAKVANYRFTRERTWVPEEIKKYGVQTFKKAPI